MSIFVPFGIEIPADTIMEFKIDAKDTYTVIQPLTASWEAAATALLSAQCSTLTVNGSVNYIIDLGMCQNADPAALGELAELAATHYEAGCSFVLTRIQPAVMQQLKAAELDDVLNCTPTLIEAVDMVSMEILERDLFDEADE